MTPCTRGGNALTAWARFGGDVLDYSANLSPLGIPPAVQAVAVTAAVDSARYPSPPYRALRAAIAVHNGVAPGQMLCNGGAAELISRLAYALRLRRTLATAPTFSECGETSAAAEYAVAYYPLYQEGRFDASDGLLDVITPGAGLVSLCTPNNPTEWLVSGALLRTAAEQCRAVGVALAMDECLLPFSDGTGSELAPCPAEHPNLLLL